MMKRREFLTRTAVGLGAAWVGSRAIAQAAAVDAPVAHFSASDTVTLGMTGIKTSRLACGTGTNGVGGASMQTRRLTMEGVADLLVHGYEENGLRFFDTAGAYGTQPAIGMALKRLPREKITIVTKSDSRDVAGMKADLDQFRRQMQTDYIDIMLIHDIQASDWTTRYRPIMDVLSEAKAKGIIRSHGCSCHTLGALKAAAASPWVEVDLARINPIGHIMDADPATVVPILRQMRAAGKGVVGMKILGAGALRNRQSEALKYALDLGVLNAMTIGAANISEQNDLVHRISQVPARAV